MTEVVISTETLAIVVVDEGVNTLVVSTTTETIAETVELISLVDVAAQGPMGPQGPQGPAGSAGSAASYIAAVGVSGHVAIVLNADGQCLPADASNMAHVMVAGITNQSAVAGSPVVVVEKGVLEHVGWTFTPDLPVFLGLAGALAQTVPPTAVFSKVLGIAVSPTRISIAFQPAIFT